MENLITRNEGGVLFSNELYTDFYSERRKYRIVRRLKHEETEALLISCGANRIANKYLVQIGKMLVYNRDNMYYEVEVVPLPPLIL